MADTPKPVKPAQPNPIPPIAVVQNVVAGGTGHNIGPQNKTGK